VWPGGSKLPEDTDSVILEVVRVLSNFLGRGDGAHSPVPIEYRKARPDEVPSALAIILGSGGVPAGDPQVTDFLQLAAQRDIDVREVWVATAHGRPLWAILPILSPGHTAMLFTPGPRPEVLDLGPLVEAVCQSVTGHGAVLAQILADPTDHAARARFAELGFREMAELLYLHCGPGRDMAPIALPENFRWQTYSPQTHELFERAILESYQQSLDCPALNGVREIGDVIAAHKASGEFDPRFWFVLIERDEPRGVLLLSRVPRTDTAELVYLGLVPQVRGRGIGDLLMRQALLTVLEMSLARLTLAVDSKNSPALQLYFRHGMQRIGSKVAMMRDLRVLSTPAPHVP